jgi:hypothetical protein
VIFVKKKSIVMVLSLLMAISITVTTVAIALAHNDEDDNRERNDSSNVVFYGKHGSVIIQFPLGNPKVTNVTSLKLIATHRDKKSAFGESDILQVALWVPVANNYVPVAAIVDNSNPDWLTFVHTVFNNTQIWFPPNFQNVIVVDDKVLDVWMDDDVLMANLTSTIKISLPFQTFPPFTYMGNLTFNLPPLQLMFRPTARSFHWEESSTVVPHPPLSGYTIKMTSMMSPAWVRVDIPLWVKGASLECTGHICTHIVETAIPPAT